MAIVLFSFCIVGVRKMKSKGKGQKAKIKNGHGRSAWVFD
jgi:hypothetical protein